MRSDNRAMKHALLILTAAVSFQCCRSAGAASRPELRFLELKNLPNSGIKFKLMPKSAEAPLPTPQTATYTMRSSTGETSRKEMYSPYELWIHDQHAGIWSDSAGNMLSLAIVRYPLPTGFKHHHAPREDYEAEATKLLEKQKGWDIPSLTAWARDYLKDQTITAEAPKQRPFKFSALAEFTFAKDSQRRWAYAFVLNKSAAGQQLAPQHCFFVYIEAAAGVDAQRAAQAVKNEFIRSIGVPPMSAEHKVAASRAFQVGRKNNLSGNDDRSDEYKRSRDVVKQSIANLKDWWFAETEHFILLSNLNTRYRSTLTDLQKNIEHLRYAYELLMPPTKAISAVSVIRVPGSAAEYKGYVGPNYEWSGGIWMPARRELVIRPMEGGSSKQQKEQMLSTTYHEGFHQYLFYALDQGQAHPWFNEGHACFFESVTLNNTRFVIEEHPHMTRDVDAIMKSKALDVASLIDMDYKQFYAGNDAARKNNYASAWLLIYYLRKHAAFDSSSPYARIPQVYFSELAKSRDSAAANTKAFQGIDISALQQDIEEFWQSRNMRVKARYNTIFKDYKPGSRR